MLGARQPNLTATLFQPFEQRRTARGVEVGGNFIEEEDRAAFDGFGDEIGMREDDAEQERFLLAGRAR